MFNYFEDWREYKSYVRPLIMQDPHDALKRLTATAVSDAYNRHFEFRVMTQILTAQCQVYCLDHYQAISTGKKVIELLEQTDYLTLLAEAYNVTGLAFLSAEMVSELIHCYRQVIHLESITGRTSLTAIAYNNIGAVYDNLDNRKKSIEFYEMALANLVHDDYDVELNRSLDVFIRCNLIIRYCLIDACDKSTELLSSIDHIVVNEREVKTHRQINFAKMVYYLKHGDVARGRESFELATSYAEHSGDVFFIIELNITYCRLCRDSGLPYDDYIHSALGLLGDDVNNAANREMFDLLEIAIDYYKSIGDTTNAMACYDSLRQCAKRYTVFVAERQAHAIDVREDLERIKIESDSTKQQNKELQLITREAIETKNKLQNAYQQIQTISILGQKITSATDLNSLAQLVFGFVRHHMHLTSFVLMIKDATKQQLNSALLYENDQIHQQISIALSNTDSIIVQCFLAGEKIIVDDFSDDIRKPILIDTNSQEIASAICLPIHYEAYPIGVLSVQSAYKNIYSIEEIDFLTSVLPYLSIAINNVNRSTILRDEILSHKRTQDELKTLNDYLKRLSSLDGLTQVNNRRMFDATYSTLLKQSEADGQAIAVIMLDIDYFKDYNDRYGHLEGDEALIKVAQKIDCAFQSDRAIFARFGGEEFIAVVSGLDLSALETLCEQVRLAVASLAIPNEHTPSGFLTISIGAAYCEHVRYSYKSRLMKASDDALYAAKNNGRNRIEHQKINA